MKNLFRLMLIACLVLPFAACKKAEAPKVEKPAVAMPTDPANKQGWMEYMGDIVTRNMDGVSNPNPYAYLLPAESAADFQDQYDSLLDKASLKRDDVYIANVLKCRPPGNRNPKPEEIEACSPFQR